MSLNPTNQPTNQPTITISKKVYMRGEFTLEICF